MFHLSLYNKTRFPSLCCFNRTHISCGCNISWSTMNITLLPLTLLAILSMVSAILPSDCDNPSLSIKSKNLCKRQRIHVKSNTVAPITKSSTTTTSSSVFVTTEPGTRTPVPFYVTSTMDPFNEEDMEDMGDQSLYANGIPCQNLTRAEIEEGVFCKNKTQPIRRWRDPVFEKLIQQVWSDIQFKITRDRNLKGISLDPLTIDQFLPGGKIDVDQEGTFYSASLQMWNIQIHGLPTIHMQEILVTRADDLSDIEMVVTVGFHQMSANGTYNLNGWMGWAEVNSEGDQVFEFEVVNATIEAKVTLDTVEGDRSGCDAQGGVLITEMVMPLLYDDISFNFNNIGSFYNTLVNGLGVYLIKTQEQNMLDAIKAMIRDNVNSLICPTVW